MKKLTSGALAFILLFAFDAILWSKIFSFGFKEPSMHFLNIGQGDSELIALPANVKILIDGGKPNSGILERLDRFLKGSRYIDLTVMTHPQLDHFGGLIDVLANYNVGAFIGTGRIGSSAAYGELMRILREKNIPYVFVKRGDRILYRDNIFEVLWPDSAAMVASELNDTSVVMQYQFKNFKALFTGDITAEDERGLMSDLDKVQVLKVAHHGSRFASTKEFLDVVKPDIAVIEVGKNSYGHPTKDALARLREAGAKIFRTDQNGNVIVRLKENELQVFTERP